MSRFAGKTAVITGGADGIGAAYALALADAGVHVAVLDVLDDKAAETSRAVADRGVKSIAVHADVTDPASLSAAQEQVVKDLGPVALPLDAGRHRAGARPGCRAGVGTRPVPGHRRWRSVWFS